MPDNTKPPVQKPEAEGLPQKRRDETNTDTGETYVCSGNACTVAKNY